MPVNKKKTFSFFSTTDSHFFNNLDFAAFFFAEKKGEFNLTKINIQSRKFDSLGNYNIYHMTSRLGGI